MDTGPVDAGPSADDQYEDPTQPPSPEQERFARPRKEGLRSASTRRGAARGGYFASDENGAEIMQYPPIRGRTLSGGTENSLKPPTQDDTGTTAETKSGERDSQMEDEARSKKSRDVPSEANRHRIYKFTLYETNTRYWITGSDIADKSYRLLRIDRTSPPGQIALFEDETTYNRKEINDVLVAIHEGNKKTEGLRLKCNFWGVLGFIRFTEAYYMLIITKRHQCAMIGGHYVYHIDGTELVPLTTGPSNRFAQNRNQDETKFLETMNKVDLSKSFYFSYSYDITNSLQNNIIRERQAMIDGEHIATPEFNTMFVWNHHLLKPAVSALKHPFDWCLPIVHGFIDQSSLDIFGRAVYITIIGRRSRFFAGARFLKRGVNDQGHVANDVETEQIVAEKLNTSFHAPGPRLYSAPTYTSFVQHRGSIPVYWTQENNTVAPKPPIGISLPDPFYSSAALHFDNLFERYGCPIYVLNLIKSRERQPREGKLGVEYEQCIDYLNQSLPKDKRIMYKAFDMSREAKAPGGDPIGRLEVIAKEIVPQIGFFKNGDENSDMPMVQNGVARTNCIDCLDRTNAAQFTIGKVAFAMQLKALGVIERDDIDFDTDAMNIFTSMFHNHGDTIAIQYGGSHLVNTTATYRKLNQWQTRDVVESVKRYYHNSFFDTQRQESYNLFLGMYEWNAEEPALWDLMTDYYLHHASPKSWLDRKRRNYIHWYNPEFLEPRKLPPKPMPQPSESKTTDAVAEYDDYWIECYRPAALSSLGKVYAYRMTSSNRYLPERPHRDSSKYDFSPFKTRVDPQRHNSDAPERRAQRKGVKILDPHDEATNSPRPPTESGFRPPTAGDDIPSILRESSWSHRDQTPEQEENGVKPLDKTQMHNWTLNQFYTQSLNPSVSAKEAREYERYVAHPLNLPLVVSTEQPSDANMDYVEYVHKAGGVEFDDFDQEETFASGVSDHDLNHFADFIKVREDPLTVTEEDLTKKRYKAYGQWLKGKSLFKQSKLDPEYKAT